jgi:signal transduction histidine kinase
LRRPFLPHSFFACDNAADHTFPNGKPAFLAEWEEKANAGQELQLPAPWDDPFVKEWLTLPRKIADHDLRGVLYVSREHAPLISPQDPLSSEAAELLTALLKHPDVAAGLKDRLTGITSTRAMPSLRYLYGQHTAEPGMTDTRPRPDSVLLYRFGLSSQARFPKIKRALQPK